MTASYAVTVVGERDTTAAFSQRLFDACVGVLGLLHVYVGDQLGLYAALTTHRPLTSVELAERAGIHDRYAREWLEQQAVAGIDAVDAAAEPASRCFSLPPGHTEALLDAVSLALVAPLALGVVGVAQALPVHEPAVAVLARQRPSRYTGRRNHPAAHLDVSRLGAASMPHRAGADVRLRLLSRLPSGSAAPQARRRRCRPPLPRRARPMPSDDR